MPKWTILGIPLIIAITACIVLFLSTGANKILLSQARSELTEVKTQLETANIQSQESARRLDEKTSEYNSLQIDLSSLQNQYDTAKVNWETKQNELNFYLSIMKSILE